MASLDPLDDLTNASKSAVPAGPVPPKPVPPTLAELGSAMMESSNQAQPPAPPPSTFVQDAAKVLAEEFDFQALQSTLKRKGLDAAAQLDSKKLLKGVIPTGHAGFDEASGIGGIGCGVITEMFGAESVGKSTIALKACANAQRMFGKPVLWVDQEHSFDPIYAATFGMILDNPKMLYVPQPTNIEDSFEICKMMLKNGFKGVIVYDSLGAGLPREVLDNPMGEMRVGLKSQVMGVCLQQLEPLVHANQAAMIFINQLRSNIRIQQRGEQRIANADVGDDASITTPGGWIMKHIASVRIQLRKLHARVWEEREGKSEIEVKFIKNKLAEAYDLTLMVLRYGHGFDPYDKALADKVLKRV